MIGSSAISILGICWNENQIRLLGGGLILNKMCPSSFLRTTASTRLTSLALKREPRSLRAVAATSMRKLPVYRTSASAVHSPSTFRSLKRGLVIYNAESPVLIFWMAMPDRKDGRLTLAIFFKNKTQNKHSISL